MTDGVNMNYIVIDLEWNQRPPGRDEMYNGMQFEIIEIGAVKLNEDKVVADHFSELINPQVYKELHYMTKDIIKLKIEDLKTGDYFENVIQRFFAWCGEDYIFCTWGPMDLTELQKNIAFYHLTGYIDKPVVFYDIQKIFALTFEESEKKRILRTLEYAVDYLNIDKGERFHRAIYDAEYTAQVLQRIPTDSLKKNYSIDCYHNPKTREEEIYIVFDAYSKYVSKEYQTKEEALKDKEVCSSRCYKCNRNALKKIRWFSNAGKTYYCLAFCKDHGLLRGKIKMKKTEEGNFYVIKTLKLVTEEAAKEVIDKQDDIKARRKKKHIRKREEIRERKKTN